MNALRPVLISATALLVAACQDTSAPIEQITPRSSVNPAAEAGSYIVVFRDGVGDPGAAARSLTATFGGDIRFVYQNAIRGFAVTGLPAAAAEAIGRNPRDLVRSGQHDEYFLHSATT